jgi:hypothetical protein
MQRLLSALLARRRAHGAPIADEPDPEGLTALCIFDVNDTFAETLHNPIVLLDEILQPMEGAAVCWAGAGRCLLLAPAATPPASHGLWEIAALVDFPPGTTPQQLHELGSSLSTDRRARALGTYRLTPGA